VYYKKQTNKMNMPNKQKKHVNTENRIVVTKGEGAGGE